MSEAIIISLIGAVSGLVAGAVEPIVVEIIRRRRQQPPSPARKRFSMLALTLVIAITALVVSLLPGRSIVRLGYQHRFTVGVPFTPWCDGFIYVSPHDNVQARARVSVPNDDEKLLRTGWVPSGESAMFPVRKGQTVVSEMQGNGDAHFLFIPIIKEPQ